MNCSKSRASSLPPAIQRQYLIKAWAGALKGYPAFILGCAPSILSQNVSLLENYFTIGINRAYRLLDPVVLMWQDKDFLALPEDVEGVGRSTALKVCRDACDPSNSYYHFRIGSPDYRFDETCTHVLHGRGSTGPLAVQMAVAMGCSPIVLLGMDCKTEGSKTDFHGKNPFHTRLTIDHCLKGLQFIHNKCPQPILSCGNSDLWPRSILADVIAGLPSDANIGRQAYQKILTQQINDCL